MASRLALAALLAAVMGVVQAQEIANPAMPCYAALAGDARFLGIREKVALSGATEDMRRLSRLGERAGPAEIPALSSWRAARQECHKLELPYYATRDSGISAAAREHFNAVQRLISEVESGSLSYGDFSKQRLELGEKTTRQIEQIRQKIAVPKPDIRKNPY